MLHKSYDILEAKADSESGTFEATVAVFNNVDKIGDRIVPGAFKNTLARWAESGDPIPVILSHQWDNPMAHVGVVEDAKETTKGLWIKGRLDVADNDVAKQVHRLMKRRSLKEFSFGYTIPKGGEKKAKDGANDLLEIDLAEVGPTLKGMNPATELHGVKSALGVEDPPDPVVQRKEADRVAREAAEEKFPDVPPPEPDPEPEQPEPDPVPTKSVEELRREANRVQREQEEARLPDIPPAEPPEDLRSVLERLETELQEVKTAHEEARALIDDLTKKAEATNQEPSEARRADPLRQQADRVALEFASAGQSLRKPPKPPAPQAPEQPELDLGDLKRRMREEILVHLSGGTP